MSGLFGSAVVGLPALLGVVLGIRLYVGGAPWVVGALVVLVAAQLARRAGQGLLPTRPRLGRWLIETWIVAAVAATALATAFLTWLGISTPTWIFGDLSKLDADTVKAITAAFITAVSTYVALVWTKDIGDAKGFFWPSTAFRAGMAAAYDGLGTKPAGATRVFEAMFEDVVEGEGPIGWDFSARGIRAGILAGYLRSGTS